MKSLPVFHALLLAALLQVGSAASAADPAPKPNFVIVNIDDLGYADIGPFGSKLNRTPNLDRMAAEGRKLTCFYAAPVCSPSRAALMTGCYPKRVLPIPGVLFPLATRGLNPEERTVAETLKEAGYATACIGKWHLGDQPEFLPTRQGFDSYLGIPYSNDMGTAEDGSKSNLGAPIPQPKAAGKRSGRDEFGARGFDQPPIPLLQDETAIARVRQPEQQGIVRRYTEAALAFIRQKRERPFFLYLPHNAVHFPLYPGKEFLGRSKNDLYGDWVEEVDWSLGRILDALRERGLDSNTLVLFTSDNGGTQRAVNTPLRGFKGSTWEGGMRVPTIAWWPGKIPAATATDEIAGMIDVLPTFARLADASLPSGRVLDGRDIWPLLSGEPEARSPHETFYFYRGLDLQAVRSGRWKLHLAKKELFDLQEDAGETRDVANAQPDIVAKLQSRANEMDADLGVKGIGPGCRALGSVPEARPWLP